MTQRLEGKVAIVTGGGSGKAIYHTFDCKMKLRTWKFYL